MSTEAELINALAMAESTGTHAVDPAPYAGLDRDAAYRIQAGVITATGASVGMLKTGIHPDGVGVAAPIFAARVGKAEGFRMPAANAVGLEVEVGMVLARDVTSSAGIPGAIDHFFVGVEICGSRFTDRNAAGLLGGFADNMSALGYAIGAPRALGDRIDGLEIEVSVDGRQLYLAAAKHAFDTVTKSLAAYADHQHAAYPLKAGTIVTTGSMCGLVPYTGTGTVVARLGDEAVTFDLV